MNWNRPQSKKSRGVNWNRPQSKKSRGVNWNTTQSDRTLRRPRSEKMSANRTSSRNGGSSQHLPRDASGNGRSLRRTSSTSRNRVRGRPAKVHTRSISSTGHSTAVTDRDTDIEPDDEVDQPRITADRQSRRKDKDGRIDVAAATQHHQSRTMFTSAEDALLALGAEGRLTVTDVSTQPNEVGFARSGPLPLEVTAESGQ